MPTRACALWFCSSARGRYRLGARQPLPWVALGRTHAPDHLRVRPPHRTTHLLRALCAACAGVKRFEAQHLDGYQWDENGQLIYPGAEVRTPP